MWRADAPLGNYTLQNVEGVMPFNVSQGKYLSGAQQFSVAALHTANGTVPMYIGQRFGSADDGLKCHDYQYLAPLTVLSDGSIEEMAWVNDFTVELQVSY